jgi:electron transport complex protein RnfD
MMRRTEVLTEGIRDLLGAGSRHAVRSAPYLRERVSAGRQVARYLIAALPVLLGTIAFFGLHVLVVLAVAWAAGGIVLLAFSWLRGEPWMEGLLLTMVLYTLLLPPNPPLWLVALGAAVAMAIRELFGGISPFQPALVGKAILLLIAPTAMTARWIEPLLGGAGFSQWASEAVASGTPLAAAQQGQLEVPLGQLFLGPVPGLLGAASAVLLALGGLWLLATRAADWRIPVGMIFTLWLGESLLEMLYPGAFRGGWLVHLLTGGFLLAAFWLAADPATSPMTPRGKWLFSLGAALLIIVLRGLSPYSEDAIVFGILAMNLLVPWLDRVTVPRSFGGRP